MIWHPTKAVRNLGEWEVFVTQALGQLGAIEEGLRVARAGAATEALEDAIRVPHPRAQHTKLEAHLCSYLFQGVGLLGGWRDSSSLRPALLWTLWGGFWAHVGIIHITRQMSITSGACPSAPLPAITKLVRQRVDDEPARSSVHRDHPFFRHSGGTVLNAGESASNRRSCIGVVPV